MEGGGGGVERGGVRDPAKRQERVVCIIAEAEALMHLISMLHVCLLHTCMLGRHSYQLTSVMLPSMECIV